jgi:VIT1/CCC1 family predicted Fe2+/Mn2+ transporter
MPISFTEIESKIKGVILGLFGSIIASFGIALGVSVLTPERWTILVSGLIVGIASSFANSFGPLVSKSRLISNQVYSKDDLMQATGSLILTFIIIGLPLISYLLMSDLAIARIISVMTGLVLLFIFGVHRAQLENESPLSYAFAMASIGAAAAAICYLIALYFIE